MSLTTAQTVDSLFEAIQTLPIDDQYPLCGRLYDLLHGTEKNFVEPSKRTELQGNSIS